MSEDESTAKRRIDVLADYCHFPLWDLGDMGRMMRPEELPLSDDLVDDLIMWSETQAIVLQIDNRYDWPFPEFGERFGRQGLRLAQRVQDELGDKYEVSYGRTPLGDWHGSV